METVDKPHHSSNEIEFSQYFMHKKRLFSLAENFVFGCTKLQTNLSIEQLWRRWTSGERKREREHHILSQTCNHSSRNMYSFSFHIVPPTNGNTSLWFGLNKFSYISHTHMQRRRRSKKTTLMYARWKIKTQTDLLLSWCMAAVWLSPRVAYLFYHR